MDELFAAPRHPYTRGLLSAVLQPGASAAADGGGKRRLPEIPGLVPSLDSQPDACTFAPRCARADERCTTARPGFESVTEDAGDGAPHLTACWHPNTLQEAAQ